MEFVAPQTPLETIEEVNLEQLLPFEMDSLELKFIFLDDQSSQEAEQELYEVYFNYCRMFGTFQCPLQQLLFESMWVPKTATHLMCSFTTKDGKKVGIPFALTDIDDTFPCESLDYITERPIRVVLMESDEHGTVTIRDVTEEVHDLSWNLFNAGFENFRPAAWTWLEKFYPNPEASLIMENEDGREAALHVQTGVLVNF